MRSVGHCPLSIVALRYFDGLTRGLTPVRVGSGYGWFYRHIPTHADTGISFGPGWPCELRPADTTRGGAWCSGVGWPASSTNIIISITYSLTEIELVALFCASSTRFQHDLSRSDNTRAKSAWMPKAGIELAWSNVG